MNNRVGWVAFFVSLLAWCLLLRFPTFLRAFIDWDESLYVLVAAEWLNGHLPYTTVFDHKPMGVYAIFAAALALLGDSMASIRLVTTLFVFGTAVVLFLLAKQFFDSNKTAAVAALSYPLFSLGMEGLSSNTELFFIFFNVLGLWLLLRATSETGGHKWWYAVVAGLSFGAALQIKYIVVIEIGFFVAYFLLVRYRGFKDTVFMGGLLALGMLLPTVLAMFYFWSNGAWSEFYYANFEANRRHATPGDLDDLWSGFRHALQDWFKWVWPVVAAMVFISVWWGRRYGEQKHRWFLWCWLAVAFVESLVTLKFYNHYFLVTFPPLCLLWANALSRYSALLNKPKVVVAVVVVVLAFPLFRVMKKSYVPWLASFAESGDTAVNVARLIQAKIEPSDYIYIVNDKPILYYLAKAKMPTRYVFPPHIISEHFGRVANIDYAEELDEIFRKKPRVVVVKESQEKNERVEEIKARLAKGYVLDKKIENTLIYLRIGI